MQISLPPLNLLSPKRRKGGSKPDLCSTIPSLLLPSISFFPAAQNRQQTRPPFSSLFLHSISLPSSSIQPLTSSHRSLFKEKSNHDVLVPPPSNNNSCIPASGLTQTATFGSIPSEDKQDLVDKSKDKSQKILNFKNATDSNGKLTCWVFDKKAARDALVRMSIKDELAFRFVEGEGLGNFLKLEFLDSYYNWGSYLLPRLVKEF
ncbi:hypothetical protein DITRI_Ditri17bG0023000 [Diplodiscus trichospermus]